MKQFKAPSDELTFSHVYDDTFVSVVWRLCVIYLCCSISFGGKIRQTARDIDLMPLLSTRFVFFTLFQILKQFSSKNTHSEASKRLPLMRHHSVRQPTKNWECWGVVSISFVVEQISRVPAQLTWRHSWVMHDSVVGHQCFSRIRWLILHSCSFFPDSLKLIRWVTPRRKLYTKW